MIYAFILGNNPSISIAEIIAVLHYNHPQYHIHSIQKGVFLIETEKDIFQPQELLAKLGGTIKIIKIVHTQHIPYQTVSVETAITYMEPYLNKLFTQHNKYKFIFGISAYGTPFVPNTINHLGIAIKKSLRTNQSHKRAIRFINLQHSVHLDAANIRKNGLLYKGVEMCLIQEQTSNRPTLYIGQTLAVQNIDFYSFRDYGRPKRDMKVGMLPPKFAQVMINLAQLQKGQKLLDPFCGFGTILQEAVLLQIEAFGSDISGPAIESSRTNLQWLSRSLDNPKSEIHHSRLIKIHSLLDILIDKNHLKKVDAQDLSSQFKKNFFDAVVTESFLGSRFVSFPKPQEINQLRNHLETLIQNSFISFHKILKKHASLVITFPVVLQKIPKFVISDQMIDNLQKLGYHRKELIPAQYAENTIISSARTRRGSLLYARPEQIIGRELFVFISN